MAFQKGWEGGPGRPKGSKDKKWANLEYWFGLLDEVWAELDADDKAHLAMEGFKALLGRVKLPAQTPLESAENAQKTMEALKMLESKVIPVKELNGSGNNQ